MAQTQENIEKFVQQLLAKNKQEVEKIAEIQKTFSILTRKDEYILIYDIKANG